ncbi:hypothetical protein ACI2OX_03480 [Bacillus sp. N9]
MTTATILAPDEVKQKISRLVDEIIRPNADRLDREGTFLATIFPRLEERDGIVSFCQKN